MMTVYAWMLGYALCAKGTYSNCQQQAWTETTSLEQCQALGDYAIAQHPNNTVVPKCIYVPRRLGAMPKRFRYIDGVD